MKKITVLSIIALITIAFSNLSAITTGATLYFNKSTLMTSYTSAFWEEGHPLCSLECSNLRKYREKIGNSQINGLSTSQMKLQEEILAEENKVFNRAYKIAASIGKRLNASAVVCYEACENFGRTGEAVLIPYVNPTYDITKEVIATLNREYLSNSKKDR